MADEWRDVPGYAGYRVNRLGVIVGPRCTMRPRPNETGSLYVQTPGHGGMPRKLYVQVAVLTAFVGPRPTGVKAKHIDGDQANNTLGNLRWDCPPRPLAAGLTADEVDDARRTRQACTMRELAVRYGVSRSELRQALRSA